MSDEAPAPKVARCYRELIRAQIDGEQVSEDRLRIFRREEDLVRVAIAHPKAFKTCGVSSGMFEAPDYRVAWEAIARAADAHVGDGPIPYEIVTAEMRRADEDRYGGSSGQLWMMAIQSESSVTLQYGLEIVAPEVRGRHELKIWKSRFTGLIDRIDTAPQILGLHEEFVTTSIQVGATPDGGRLGRTMEDIATTPRAHDIIPTGIPQIDKATGGGHGRGEVMVWGGGTNSGKSYAVQRLARNQARLGRTVLCISTEDSESLLFCRMVADYTPIGNRESPLAIRKRLLGGPAAHIPGAASQLALQHAIDAMRIDQQGRVYSYEAKKWPVSKICALIRRHRYMANIDSVLVDYLQAIQPDEPGHNKTQEISSIVSQLKQCANDVGVALHLFSQYARDEYKDGQEPSMQACKYAGDIENESEIMCLLWRDEDDNLHAKLPKIKWVKSSEFRYIITTDPETGNFLEWNDDFAPRREEPKRAGGGGRGRGPGGPP